MVYRANGGEAGTQFSARYFSISLVAAFRFLPTLVPVIFLLVILQPAHDPISGQAASTGMEIVAFAIWYALLYAYIARNVRQVAYKSGLFLNT